MTAWAVGTLLLGVGSVGEGDLSQVGQRGVRGEEGDRQLETMVWRESQCEAKLLCSIILVSTR